MADPVVPEAEEHHSIPERPGDRAHCLLPSVLVSNKKISVRRDAKPL
jgi:hypothetical protein